MQKTNKKILPLATAGTEFEPVGLWKQIPVECGFSMLTCTDNPCDEASTDPGSIFNGARRGLVDADRPCRLPDVQGGVLYRMQRSHNNFTNSPPDTQPAAPSNLGSKMLPYSAGPESAGYF
ncbi:hypothetical protein PpBr36_01324 [Pyricularia pennisetigena]|uniref:hypothetical protein n=1 Tax=Pyricularia pennisetigena TaxID=1578925 RepID=UPI001154D871|nr:hypothetical protein PpBr36_01324 [Pyricularia pennisetigena]TLS29279.1 hypothetical protein PpBr36_01324 [Pyricularia pennisetigena]